MKYIKLLFVFIPVSLIARLLKADESLMFIAVCLSIIPLAAAIGDATEQISIYTGAKVGGLISATMSNIPELLIGFFAIRAGLYNLVLASMAGSIIGNILLVLGLSILLGGFKYKQQHFNKGIALSNFILLFFSALSIIIPFTLKHAIQINGEINMKSGLTAVTLFMALVLLVTYIAGLVFSLVTHRNIFVKHEDHEEEQVKAKWSLGISVCILVAAALLVAVESEMLVGSVEHIIRNYGLPEIFIGIIIVPILGNVAENISAIIMSIKNKVDISIEIAIGSSIQIALFVAPVLILVSFILGNPMIYIYDVFELVAILCAIGLSLYIFQDGKTNWLEGLILVCCYIILGVCFFFL